MYKTLKSTLIYLRGNTERTQNTLVVEETKINIEYLDSNT